MNTGIAITGVGILRHETAGPAHLVLKPEQEERDAPACVVREVEDQSRRIFQAGPMRQ